MIDQEKTIFEGKVVQHPLEKEITESYISYSMSVIVSRALPDTRDGFKPVLRRILFAMYDMKILHNTRHKKSARIVGEVLGKYHPHGDSSVYEAMVRMAQPWSLRYPLVDGQGNFGSVDGDSAAAMRYTEAKLTKLAEEMLEDIHQDTVDWRDNFDGSLQEPIMVPTKFPNHLCNGTMGIAVGMATNMAPHNLLEIIDASLLLIDKEGKPLSEEELKVPEGVLLDKVLLVDAMHVLFSKSDDEENILTLNTELAEYLNTLACKIIVVTNTPVANIRALLKSYDFEIFSLDHKPDKTDPKYFEKLFEKYDIEGEEVVYFDHKNENLESAQTEGVSNLILYKSNEELISKLKKIHEEILANKPTHYSISIDEIMQIVKGPDFPTGGIMYDSNNIREVYKKGRGGIVTRGKVHIEEKKNAKLIIIDQIPYMVNKSTLVAKIGELVVNKKIEGVTDIRDESNRERMRISIYLKKGMDPDKILMQLYKFTDLQTNFNLNNVSLVEKGIQPRTLNIKELLMEFVTFRREVVYRRSVFKLKKAKDRLHILEGLKKAIDIIDEVIETIKKSQTKQDAKNNLIKKFEFSEDQAEYILLMRLQSLVGLEIQRVIDEMVDKKELISYLEGIINDSDKLDRVVKDELVYIKDKYGDKRRTELSQDTSVYNLIGSLKALRDAADRIKEDVILRIGDGYHIRTLYQTRIQNIPDGTLDIIYTHNQDQLIVITDLGELGVHRLKDFGSFTMAKTALDLKAKFEFKGNIVFATTLHVDYDYLLFLTRNNNIKKIKKELILSFKKFPTVVMKLEEKETIAKVLPVKDEDNVGVITEKGRGLLFSSADVRPMGKTAGGVKAIDIQIEGDKVSNMFLYQGEPFILIHNDKEGKMLSVKDDLRVWKRARKGDVWATGDCDLKGGISIEEGSIRVRFTNGNLKTIHSNDIKLDLPDSSLGKMVNKKIDIIYRPWEEKEDNFKYKDEQQKNKKKKKKKGLF